MASYKAPQWHIFFRSSTVCSVVMQKLSLLNLLYAVASLWKRVFGSAELIGVLLALQSYGIIADVLTLTRIHGGAFFILLNRLYHAQ
jgi:uncharacterized membrane protein YesL